MTDNEVDTYRIHFKYIRTYSTATKIKFFNIYTNIVRVREASLNAGVSTHIIEHFV